MASPGERQPAAFLAATWLGWMRLGWNSLLLAATSSGQDPAITSLAKAAVGEAGGDGGKDGGGPTPPGQHSSAKAAKQPKQLQAAMERPHIDVNPTQGSAEAEAHQQQPGPTKAWTPLAPLNKQAGLGKGKQQ